MDTPEPTESTAPVVPIPAYLLGTIRAAVEQQIEFAADDVWNERTRDRLVAAVHLWEATIAEALTPAQTVTVADLAIVWIQPHWPKNTTAIDDVTRLLADTRELIELRDRAFAATFGRDERVVANDTRDPDGTKQRRPATHIRNMIDRARRRSRRLGTSEAASVGDLAGRPDRALLVEIPDLLLPVLRRAADEALERACDSGGDWDDEISARVLDAARVAEAFDLAALTPKQIADLADNALRWAEPPDAMPTTMEKVGDSLLQLGVARELINLRDRARRAS